VLVIELVSLALDWSGHASNQLPNRFANSDPRHAAIHVACFAPAFALAADDDQTTTTPSQGDNDNAVEIAQRTYERERQRSGDKSFNTALSRGFHAIALARKGNATESLQAFKESLPVLLSVSGGGDDDSGTTAAAREGRIRFVIEGYLRLLSRNPTIVPASVIEETFGFADVLRGQSVQRALQASSARSAMRPASRSVRFRRSRTVSARRSKPPASRWRSEG